MHEGRQNWEATLVTFPCLRPRFARAMLRTLTASTVRRIPLRHISYATPLHRRYEKRLTCLESHHVSPRVVRARFYSAQDPPGHSDRPRKPTTLKELRENIYTLPNLLTMSRILACPVLGWSVLQNDFRLATTLLVYAGLTDLVCIILPFFFLAGTCCLKGVN